MPASPTGASSERFSTFWTLWLPLAVFAAILVTVHFARPFYEAWIDGEEGALEMVQSLTTAAGLVVSLLALPRALRQGRRWLAAYLLLAAVCCLYVTGEELSYGQHLFGWETPIGWAEINDQEETNLHNLGMLLNELPRHALSAAVLIGGLVVPLVLWRWPQLGRHPLAVILPPPGLWPIALLSGLSGLSREKFVWGGDLLGQGSEAQETYLYWFVILYLIAIYRRLRSPAAVPATA